MLEFVLAVLILELTPGPNMAYLASVAVAQGRNPALKVTAGISLGLTTHAVAAAVGLGVLVQQYPLVYETLRWAGVLFLVWLAIEGWMQARENSPESVGPAVPGGGMFWRGLWSNVLNPKSILFFVTVVPRFVPTDSAQGARLALLGFVYVAIATAVHSAIVLLASTLQPWLVSGRRSLLIRRVLSAALLIVAGWLAWDTAR